MIPGWYIVENPNKNKLGSEIKLSDAISGPWSKNEARQELREFEDKWNLSILLKNEGNDKWQYDAD